MYVKIQKGPPFTFFGTIRLFLKKKLFQKLQVFFPKNVLRFLSLRYGADFRRSRVLFPIRFFSLNAIYFCSSETHQKFNSKKGRV